MKKHLVTLAMALMMSIGSLFANDNTEVSDKIISSFKKEFVDARDVQWDKTRDMVRATFTLNTQVMFAYYSNEGTLLAVSRNILSGQLPMSLLVDIKKNYGSYWITDLFEIVMDNETSYYLTVENSDQTMTLKANGSAAWEVFKKEKKS